MSDRAVAIVTGAGSGIGAACARGLAADGLAVVLVGRRASALHAVERDLAAAGGEALAVIADLALADAAAEVVAAAVARFGRIDVLVNSAGVARPERVEAMSAEHFDEQVAVNLRAPALLLGAALAQLQRSPRASVVNISSSAGTVNRPGQSVYAMTKAGLNHLTRSWAAELAPSGVRVNAVAPGRVDTPAHRTWAADRAALDAAMGPNIPAGRVGEAEEIALWVRHLCDPAASWTTGAIISVDGGHGLDHK